MLGQPNEYSGFDPQFPDCLCGCGCPNGVGFIQSKERPASRPLDEYPMLEQLCSFPVDRTADPVLGFAVHGQVMLLAAMLLDLRHHFLIGC